MWHGDSSKDGIMSPNINSIIHDDSKDNNSATDSSKDDNSADNSKVLGVGVIGGGAARTSKGKQS